MEDAETAARRGDGGRQTEGEEIDRARLHSACQPGSGGHVYRRLYERLPSTRGMLSFSSLSNRGASESLKGRWDSPNLGSIGPANR
eukprot:scaffold256_cov261-Pinguiococcus_pyrenoidosus.AAC.27